MSSINNIISKKIVSTIVKDGKSVVVSAATETSHWKRPDSMAQKVGSVLKESLESWGGKLPEDTKEVCSRLEHYVTDAATWLILVFRESDHKSDADKRDHITAVCFDSKDQGKTIHVPVKKTESGIT